MHDLHKKIAYLQGLMTGLGNNSSTNEGRILSEMLSILDSFADELKELQDSQAELESYVETIDEDLLDLEDEVYYIDLKGDEDDLEDDLVEVQCPECKDIVYFNADLLDEDDIIEVTCPTCDAVVYSNEDETNLVVDRYENQHFAEDN
jgi:endogenous inhibitor of DNA gyrase (YacG/DUF329 family)